MKKLAVIGAIALFLLALPSAHAGGEDEAYSTVVRVRDVDLNQIAGVRKLYTRIQKAARMVCSRRDPGATDSIMVAKTARAEYRICVARAIDAAVSRVCKAIDRKSDYNSGKTPNPTATQIRGTSIQCQPLFQLKHDPAD